MNDDTPYSAHNFNLEKDALKTLNNLSDNYSEKECSPSKNWCLGPWISAKQSLNSIYNKKIPSPSKVTRSKGATYRKNRLFSLFDTHRKMSTEHNSNANSIAIKTPKHMLYTNMSSMNNTHNGLNFSEDLKCNANEHRKTAFNNVPTLNSSINHTKPILKVSEMMNTMYNSKLKLMLSTLEAPTNLPMRLKLLNPIQANNPVLTKVSKFYHPKKVMLRRIFCNVTTTDRESIIGMKENNAPNVFMRAFRKCKY